MNKRKSLAQPKLNNISITRQCELLGFARSDLYYKPRLNDQKQAIKKRINEIYNEIPIYGEAKVYHQLLEEGFVVSHNTVSKYRKALGLKACLAIKHPNTTIPNKNQKRYSYKLKDVDIDKANQVWSTDVTYVKIKEGFIYLAAIIDWKSKAVLSHKISNTMDINLVMDVLNNALKKYPKPDYFNTD